MHLIDMQRRLDYLTEKYLEASDPDELDRLHDQMQHYRKEIKSARIAELEEHLGSLEYEVRRETGADRDDTADYRDEVRQKLEKLKRHT